MWYGWLAALWDGAQAGQATLFWERPAPTWGPGPLENAHTVHCRSLSSDLAKAPATRPKSVLAHVPGCQSNCQGLATESLCLFWTERTLLGRDVLKAS